jgi:hypothetical protein
VNYRGKQATIPIVYKIDLRPGFQCSFDAGAEAPVGQNSFGCIGNQNGVADNGITVTDFFNGQIVWKMAWADDFNPN